MSRSAADATRFTATRPHATSKTSGAPYELPEFLKTEENKKKNKTRTPQTGPDGKPETPKQKVERLRAQARASRMAQSSGVDRWIEAGRRFANKAHKGTVYSLIVASGVCGVLTVYSMVSLTLYNRRQRTLWIERELETLKQARIAQANGYATEEQLELVKKEDIEEIYQRKKAEEKAKRPWAKVKQYLFSGMKAEDTSAAATSAVATETPVMDAVNAQNAFEAAAAKTVSPVPGQLDVIAENAEHAVTEKTKSWTSWLTGR
ncbi:hypothetical protein N7495_002850 [Penicillium taxi]|uniref:uncharacterized protein n=1 Tax=Penicillium taxi TaxID=168475 RepID=UPI0025451200|nr:uncharacterized protein N7495_002850 [Penicillium taxi]KAJ5902322.1 hypothetical protein N7495_002850 [Penicillium taxi]